MENRQSQLGYSTLEILIAFAILIMSLSAIIAVSFGSQTVAVDSQTNDEALYKAQKQLEDARALSRDNFYSVHSISPVNDDIYSKEVIVDWFDDHIKEIMTRVTWIIEGRSQKVELTTRITNPEGSFRGDTCDPNMTGNWTEPTVIGSIDIVSNEGATDIDTRLYKIYMTTNPSAYLSEDFYVIDVSNPSSPYIVSKIHTGNGLVALRVTERYAFAANRSVNGQLQIIDISNPAEPEVKVNFKIPVPPDVEAVSCTDGYGKSIFLKNNVVYLGLNKTDKCPEFNIIDISDPLNPEYLGGWEADTSINDIYVRDNVAYLATPWAKDSSDLKENLSILDISNPANINPENYFTAIDATIQSGESLFFDGNTLYFGRSYGGKKADGKKELFILDVSDPFKYPIPSESKKIEAGGIFSSILRGKYLFVMARVDEEKDPNTELQIWDVSDPANIPDKPYAAIKVVQGSTGGMDCEGNLIYIAQRSQFALQIIGPKE